MEENVCDKIGIWTEEKERIYKILTERVERAVREKSEGMDEDSEEFKKLVDEETANQIWIYEFE